MRKWDLLPMRSLILLTAALLLAACTTSPKPAEPVKEYSMHGQVTALNPADNTATINADEIKGWMGAMAMEYKIKDRAEFEKLQKGETIDATVFVQGDDYWVGKIQPGQAAPPAPPAPAPK
jgi:Cu/Ag efflux protein CusF